MCQAGKTFAPGAFSARLGASSKLWQYSSPKKSSRRQLQLALHTGYSISTGLTTAAVRTRASTQDETAWTVALHLDPWGAAQQIPRESRQDARTGVLWGRRAKRRQPSRPPVKRARHSQVSTDAARALKNTSAAARKKKTSKTHPRDERTKEPRAGVWTSSNRRVKRTKCKRLLGPRGFLTYTSRERIITRA